MLLSGLIGSLHTIPYGTSTGPVVQSPNHRRDKFEPPFRISHPFPVRRVTKGSERRVLPPYCATHPASYNGRLLSYSQLTSTHGGLQELIVALRPCRKAASLWCTRSDPAKYNKLSAEIRRILDQDMYFRNWELTVLKRPLIGSHNPSM
jgi:hypothetical protein